MGRGLGGDREARGLGRADQGHAAEGADVGDVEAAAGEPAQGEVPEDHDFFGRGGDAP